MADKKADIPDSIPNNEEKNKEKNEEKNNETEEESVEKLKLKSALVKQEIQLQGNIFNILPELNAKVVLESKEKIV